MTIQLDTKIVNAKREPIRGEGGQDLTVRECLTLLLTYYPAPRKDMFSQLSAGMKIGDEAVREIELSKKELETVKKAIEANKVDTDKGQKPIYGSWILGQVRQAIGDLEDE